MPIHYAGALRPRAILFLCLFAAGLSCAPNTEAQSILFIGGSPPTSVAVGDSYQFEPRAFAFGGWMFGGEVMRGVGFGFGAQQFTAQNLPHWASFSPDTGEIYGQPTSADVGVYSNIRIHVTNGLAQAALAPFSITVTLRGGGAGPAMPTPNPSPSPGVSPPTGGARPDITRPSSTSATLSWNPPLENTDGSALSQLSGYRIYAGRTSSNLQPLVTLDNPGLSRYVVESLEPGRHYFAISALGAGGLESALSGVVSKSIE